MSRKTLFMDPDMEAVTFEYQYTDGKGKKHIILDNDVSTRVNEVLGHLPRVKNQIKARTTDILILRELMAEYPEDTDIQADLKKAEARLLNARAMETTLYNQWFALVVRKTITMY